MSAASGDRSEDGRGDARRRRLRRIVLIVVVVLGVCVAVPAGLVGNWFFRGTLAAGTGSPCPGCAVDDFFGYGPLATLGGDNLRFARTLCRPNRAALHEQATTFARTYVDAARKWNVAPMLSHGAMVGDEPDNIRDGRASITVEVTHSLDAPGGNVVARKTVPWRFEVVDEDGWRVCAVGQPDVCRDLIICDGPATPGPSVGSTASAAARVWDLRVPYRCLPDKPYRDLATDCPSPPPDWVQPGPYFCAPDQPFGIPASHRDECAALGWT